MDGWLVGSGQYDDDPRIVTRPIVDLPLCRIVALALTLVPVFCLLPFQCCLVLLLLRESTKVTRFSQSVS